jgi:hypothetical protein
MKQSVFGLGVLGGILLAATQAFSASYYVDYASGLDSNSGTSVTSPWKRCPGMPGFAHAYQHAAGDRFIFKGGVTWPSGCFPLSVSVGGTASSGDYYGIDPTWYAGSSWSRPVFTGAGATGVNLIVLGGGSYITVDGLELRDLVEGNSIMLRGSTYVTMTNLYSHNWNHGSAGSMQPNGGIYNYGYPNTGNKVTHCTIDNFDGDGNSGCCVYGTYEVEFCKLGNANDGVQKGTILIHDNEFYELGRFWDPASHPDCTYLTASTPIYFYNNYMHGSLVGMIIYPTGWMGAGPVYVYNNLVWHTNGVPTVYMTVDGANANISTYVYNNTFVHVANDGNGQMTVYAGGGNTCSVFNNLFINQGPVTSIATGQAGNHPSGNNIEYTSFAAAAAAGYTPQNLFAPSSASASVIGAGNNLASLNLPGFGYDSSLGGRRTAVQRSAAGAWDVGACGFAPSGPVTDPIISLSSGTLDFASRPVGSTNVLTCTVQNIGAGVLTGAVTVARPFSVVSGGTYGLRSNQTQTVTIAYIPTAPSSDAQTLYFTGGGGASKPVTGSAWAVLPGLSFASSAGTITAPFVNSGGFLSQNVSTGVGDGGRAVYGFSIASPGNYIISASVNAPGDGANSFYVSIDSEPTDPANIWDIPITAGFTNQTVTWRGNGTDLAPQFVPAVFNLSAGPHALIVRGREPGVQLGTITISTNSLTLAAPPTVSPIAQSAPDADPNTPGLQVFAGVVVQYSASATDPNGLPLTWQWTYAINGGPETVLSSGTGPVSGASYNYTASAAGNTYAWKLRVSNGQATAEANLTVAVVAAPAGDGVIVQAASGVVTLPMVLSNGYISQPTATSLADSGRAAYSFTLTNAGTFAIQGLVNAANDGANSFFVNIDGEPQDPGMIWDIPVTSGFEARFVSWRGNGTFDNNQFAPKTFNLSQGLHEIVIRGREAGTALQSMAILRLPPPPQNVHITLGP